MAGQRKLKAGQRAADRHRRPRLAPGALPGRRGRRPHRPRRLRRGRRDQPAAPDHPRHLDGRRGQARVGTAPPGRPQPATSRSTTYETQITSRERARPDRADYDVIVDGTDNFPTRYLVNDACVLLGKPNVYGSIFRFEGQATVFYAQGRRPVLPLPLPRAAAARPGAQLRRGRRARRAARASSAPSRPPRRSS